MRIRRIIVGALAWVILSAQAPQPKAEPQQEQAAAQPKPAAPSRSLPVAKVNQPANSTGYQEPCQGTESDQNSDLCAQWTAAKAARDAANYAGWQLGAAVLGMLGLIATIYLTLKAVRAAQASVAVAQDTAKRQLRAYVVVRNFLVCDLEIGKAPRVTFEIKNVGQTPAYELRSYAELFVVPKGASPDAAKVRFRHDKGNISTTIIGAGVHGTSQVRFDNVQSDQRIIALQTGELILGVFGVISYRDIFKRRRLLTFKLFLQQRAVDEEGYRKMTSCAKGSAAN